MTIVVNPHSPTEEKALLAFLDSMKYDYIKEEGSITLSEAQKQEVLERDRLYETGEMKSYSLDEMIAHFKLDPK